MIRTSAWSNWARPGDMTLPMIGLLMQHNCCHEHSVLECLLLAAVTLNQCSVYVATKGNVEPAECPQRILRIKWRDGDKTDQTGKTLRDFICNLARETCTDTLRSCIVIFSDGTCCAWGFRACFESSKMFSEKCVFDSLCCFIVTQAHLLLYVWFKHLFIVQKLILPFLEFLTK